ncbi:MULTISPECIES: PTS sugar transporter subunit IIB [Lactobacillus]|nr:MULTISPECIES: hypothetical protein [Lactobacillus]
MNILLACGGGMSSSILATALTKEASKIGTFTKPALTR